MLREVAGEIHPEDIRVHVEIPHYNDDNNPNDLLGGRSYPEWHLYPKVVPVSTRWIQRNGVWIRLYGEVIPFNARDSQFLRHFFHEMNRVERDASNNTAEHVANVLYGRILAATPGSTIPALVTEAMKEKNYTKKIGRKRVLEGLAHPGLSLFADVIACIRDNDNASLCNKGRQELLQRKFAEKNLLKYAHWTNLPGHDLRIGSMSTHRLPYLVPSSSTTKLTFAKKTRIKWSRVEYNLGSDPEPLPDRNLPEDEPDAVIHAFNSRLCTRVGRRWKCEGLCTC